MISITLALLICTVFGTMVPSFSLPIVGEDKISGSNVYLEQGVAKRGGYTGNLKHSDMAGIIGSSWLTLTDSDIKADPVGVCRHMESKFNAFVKNIETCPWKYTCNYNENRYPQYMLQANCLRQYEFKPSTDCGKTNGPKQCIPITTLVRVQIKTEDDEDSTIGSGSQDDELSYELNSVALPCGKSGCEERELLVSVGCKLAETNDVLR